MSVNPKWSTNEALNYLSIEISVFRYSWTGYCTEVVISPLKSSAWNTFQTFQFSRFSLLGGLPNLLHKMRFCGLHIVQMWKPPYAVEVTIFFIENEVIFLPTNEWHNLPLLQHEFSKARLVDTTKSLINLMWPITSGLWFWEDLKTCPPQFFEKRHHWQKLDSFLQRNDFLEWESF